VHCNFPDGHKYCRKCRRGRGCARGRQVHCLPDKPGTENREQGYSLFFAPSPAMREAYPHLKNLWEMGPTAAPYDTMHLVLLNVVSHMWKLFAGLKLVDKKKDEA